MDAQLREQRELTHVHMLVHTHTTADTLICATLFYLRVSTSKDGFFLNVTVSVCDALHLCVCAYRTLGSCEHAGCVTARGSGYISIPPGLTSLCVGGLSVREQLSV